jgi:hypothetical protein
VDVKGVAEGEVGRLVSFERCVDLGPKLRLCVEADLDLLAGLSSKAAMISLSASSSWA